MGALPILWAASWAIFLAPPVQPIRGRLATVGPDGTPWEEVARSSTARLRRQSKDRLQISPALGGLAGDEISTLGRCGEGTLAMWGGSAGAAASLIPELNVFELPFLFDNEAEIDAVFRGPAGGIIADLFASHGLQLYGGLLEVGWRHFAGKKPLRAAADFRGLRVRSQDNEIHLQMWHLLGARPIALSVLETLDALQSGLVEAFDQSPVFAFATGWYHAVTTYVLSRHIYQVGFVVLCKGTLDSLGPRQRAEALAGGEDDTHRGTLQVRQLGCELIEQLGREGLSVVTLTAAERNELRRLTAPTHARFSRTTSAKGRRLLGAIQDTLVRVRKQADGR